MAAAAGSSGQIRPFPSWIRPVGAGSRPWRPVGAVRAVPHLRRRPRSSARLHPWPRVRPRAPPPSGRRRPRPAAASSVRRPPSRPPSARGEEAAPVARSPSTVAAARRVAAVCSICRARRASPLRCWLLLPPPLFFAARGVCGSSVRVYLLLLSFMLLVLACDLLLVLACHLLLVLAACCCLSIVYCHMSSVHPSPIVASPSSKAMQSTISMSINQSPCLVS